jgi:UDP-glucose 6-dehydrogenase
VHFKFYLIQSFAEGTAVQDLLDPDRILIGGDTTEEQVKSDTSAC